MTSCRAILNVKTIRSHDLSPGLRQSQGRYSELTKSHSATRGWKNQWQYLTFPGQRIQYNTMLNYRTQSILHFQMLLTAVLFTRHILKSSPTHVRVSLLYKKFGLLGSPGYAAVKRTSANYKYCRGCSSKGPGFLWNPAPT